MVKNSRPASCADAQVNKDAIVGGAAVGNLEFRRRCSFACSECRVVDCTNSSTNLSDVLLNVEGDPLNELD